MLFLGRLLKGGGERLPRRMTGLGQWCDGVSQSGETEYAVDIDFMKEVDPDDAVSLPPPVRPGPALGCLSAGCC